MKAISLMFTVAAAAFGQPGWVGAGSMHGSSFSIYFQERVEPPSPEVKGCCGHDISGSASNLDRLLVYPGERIYFGFNLATEAGPNDTYTLTFRPLQLSESRAKQLRIDLSTWKQWSWAVPGPQTVRLGDVIVLDLLVNPQSGQKFVEYITVQEPFRPGFDNPTPRAFSYVAGAPRDFRVEDAQLHIKWPRFSINGTPDDSSRSSLQDATGAFVWLFAPGRGRFVLSLTPQPGFQKAGEVRGTLLNFKWGADTYTVSSAAQVAPGDAPFNIYVSHDPAWRPSADIFQIGSAARVEDLVRR